MTQKDGNCLLKKLQEHRHQGTLDAKIDYPEKSIAAGLQHLRSRYPMDEDAAISARVDRELENEFRLPQTNTEKSPYAHSGLEQIRRENKERHEREKASLKEQATQNRPGSTTVVTRPRTLRNLVQRSEEEPEWVRRYREKAQSTEMPQISTLARLFPTGVFAATIVVLSLLFAQNYTPASQQARMFPETPPAAATLMAILGINVSVFLLWRIPQMWAFMNKYFISVPLQPRPAQMLFTAFSHQELTHLLVNMIPMWFIGVRYGRVSKGVDTGIGVQRGRLRVSTNQKLNKRLLVRRVIEFVALVRRQDREDIVSRVRISVGYARPVLAPQASVHALEPELPGQRKRMSLDGR
ncbi:MAG: hypothetical protein Q9217_001251 [Psora testacea]